MNLEKSLLLNLWTPRSVYGNTVCLFLSLFRHASLCSSPLRARASAVYGLGNSLKFPVRRNPLK